MMNWHPDLMAFDLHRAQVPVRLRPTAALAPYLLRTEPGALETLRVFQEKARETSPVVLPDRGSSVHHNPSSSYLGTHGPRAEVDQWLEGLQMGLKLSRRHALQSTFAARVQFREEVLKESKNRPPLKKPYNLFCVWFLFVRGLAVEREDRAWIEAIGKFDVESSIICAPGHDAAKSAAIAVFQAIADLEESQGTGAPWAPENG